MDNKLLIVIDMQNDFIDGALGTEEAQGIVENVVNKIKENKDNQIFVTYDTHNEDYFNTLEGKKLPVEHCIHKTKGWQLNDEVENVLEECKNVDRILKPTFGYTLWENRIRMLMNLNDIKEIEICGLCTDICVVSNALILRAMFPNVIIKIDKNCCAGVTPESHEAALKTMAMCQIDII